MKKSIKWILLIILSTVFLLGFNYKILACITPLIISLFLIYLNKIKPTNLFLMILIFFVPGYLVRSIWAIKLLGFYYFLYLSLNLILICGTLWLIMWELSQGKQSIRIYLLPFVWGLAEYFNAKYLGYPGLNISFYLAQYSLFELPLMLGGFTLISCILILLVILFAQGIIEKKFKYLVIMILLILIMVIGRVFLNSKEMHIDLRDSDTLKLKLIQPQGGPVLQAIQNSDSNEIDLIILPELALAGEYPIQEEIKIRVGRKVSESNLHLLAGVKEFSSDEIYYNSLMYFDNEDRSIIYRKHNLIPVVERNYRRGRDFNKPISIRTFKLGTMVCFDIFFMENYLENLRWGVDAVIIPNYIHPSWGKRINEDFLYAGMVYSGLFDQNIIIVGEFGPTGIISGQENELIKDWNPKFYGEQYPVNNGGNIPYIKVVKLSHSIHKYKQGTYSFLYFFHKYYLLILYMLTFLLYIIAIMKSTAAKN